MMSSVRRCDSRLRMKLAPWKNPWLVSRLKKIMICAPTTLEWINLRFSDYFWIILQFNSKFVLYEILMRSSLIIVWRIGKKDFKSLKSVEETFSRHRPKIFLCALTTAAGKHLNKRIFHFSSGLSFATDTGDGKKWIWTKNLKTSALLKNQTWKEEI